MMKDKAVLEQEIRTLIARVTKQPEAKIKSEVDLFTELGIDSLLGVEILAALDQKYSIDVPEDDLRHIRTLKDIVNLISDYLDKNERIM